MHASTLIQRMTAIPLFAILALAASPCNAAPHYEVKHEMVPVEINGESLRLHVRYYLPTNVAPPYPTVIFHHGSTPKENRQRILQSLPTARTLRDIFVKRGWTVALLSRKGRGLSEGRYEGNIHSLHKIIYSCDYHESMKAFRSALADVDAATAWIRNKDFVDSERLAAAGQSRGGREAQYRPRRPTPHLVPRRHQLRRRLAQIRQIAAQAAEQAREDGSATSSPGVQQTPPFPQYGCIPMAIPNIGQQETDERCLSAFRKPAERVFFKTTRFRAITTA